MFSTVLTFIIFLLPLRVNSKCWPCLKNKNKLIPKINLEIFLKKFTANRNENKSNSYASIGDCIYLIQVWNLRLKIGLKISFQTKVLFRPKSEFISCALISLSWANAKYFITFAQCPKAIEWCSLNGSITIISIHVHTCRLYYYLLYVLLSVICLFSGLSGDHLA